MFIYVKEPPWHKAVDIVIWALVYSFVILYGISQIFWQPTTIVNETGQVFLSISGGTATLGAMICLSGVTRRIVAHELTGVWLVLGGTIVYPITVWGIALASESGIFESGRLPQSFATSLVVLLFLGRALRLVTADRSEVKLVKIQKRTEAKIRELSGE